jgi:putative copper resistance protein D
MLMKVLQSWPVKISTHPVVAAVLFVSSLYAVYFTDLFSVLMSNHLGHVVMWIHFLSVGSLFFWVLVGVDPTPVRLPALARTGLMLVTMPFHAFFAVELMSSSTVLAADYYRTLNRPYATDLLADQHLGGGVSWALGEIPMLFVMAAIFAQWIRSDAREASRADRDSAKASTGTEGGADVDHPSTELGRYNEALAALSRRENRNPEDQPEQQPGEVET